MNLLVFFVFYIFFAAAIGSFFALIFYRFNEKISIIRPASHCDFCKKRLYFYHNIPIFSYIFLRGKCAFCKAKINKLYFLSEVISIILFILAFFMSFRLDVSLLFISEFNMILAIKSLILGLFFMSFFLLSLMDVKYKAVSELWLWIFFFLAFLSSFNLFDLKLALLKLDFSSLFFYKAFVFMGFLFFMKAFINFFKNYKRPYDIQDSLAEADIIALGAMAGLFGFKKAFFMLFCACILALIYYLFKKEKELFFLPFLFLATVFVCELSL